MHPLLEIKDLAVTFATRDGPISAVRGLNLKLEKRQILGIVGESGSGKSVTTYALLKVLDPSATSVAARLYYAGMDLANLTEKGMRDIRGREISMIFQNPRTALNPVRKVGHQIEDVLIQHGQASRRNAKGRAIKALEAVRIQNPKSRFHAYPFELSGGMCQRVMIAIALACNPQLLIADEPTTGLDITTQKIVMDLVRDLINERGMSSILITHDLALAAQYCDNILVMKDGEVVEQGSPNILFSRPNHPYTQKLVNATPRLGQSIRSLLPHELQSPEPAHKPSDQVLLQVQALAKSYDSKSGVIHAVKGISFAIKHGQSVGLVGESGSGKSTTAEMLVRLLDPTAGKILFRGIDIAQVNAKRFASHPYRGQIQMVFQDATESLNPRHSARATLADPIRRLGNLQGKALNDRINELASLVGFPTALLDRFPHQLSGGQKARVGIARAIALEPSLLILDEPTAALDVSIQAVVLNLLVDLRARLNMSYLFVSHDLHVVRLLCDHVLVMKNGEVVESGPTDQVMRSPRHPYTADLLSAAPAPV
jgi:peptide/nickel transport system ATP-binding protein